MDRLRQNNPTSLGHCVLLADAWHCHCGKLRCGRTSLGLPLLMAHSRNCPYGSIRDQTGHSKFRSNGSFVRIADARFLSLNDGFGSEDGIQRPRSAGLECERNSTFRPERRQSGGEHLQGTWSPREVSVLKKSKITSETIVRGGHHGRQIDPFFWARGSPIAACNWGWVGGRLSAPITQRRFAPLHS